MWRWLAIGLLLILTLMPFHAFLSVWLGQWGGRIIIQAWKELVVALLAALAASQLYRQPDRWRLLRRPYNLAALAYVAISIIVSLWQQPPPLAWLFGMKTNLVWIALLIIAQLAAAPQLLRRALQILLATSLVVATLALLQSWALPPSWLEAVGYGPTTIQPLQLVDPAVGARRAFSTLGGPNQLGAYLLLPLCYVVALATKRLRPWHLPALALLITAIAVSYSRSAWLGGAVALIVTVAAGLPRRWLTTLGGAVVALALVALWLIPYLLTSHPSAQYYLLHGSIQDNGIKTSNIERREAIAGGIETVMQQPGGRGLGTAGPASRLAGQGLITENYYLQLAVEVGLLGLASFIAWQALLAARFWQLRTHPAARALLGSLAGLAVVNLFLHGWADSTLALVFAVVAGLTLNLENVAPD